MKKNNIKETIIDLFADLLASIIIISTLSIVFGFPTMWIYNWVGPALFGCSKIDFWTAVALNAFLGLVDDLFSDLSQLPEWKLKTKIKDKIKHNNHERTT